MSVSNEEIKEYEDNIKKALFEKLYELYSMLQHMTIELKSELSDLDLNINLRNVGIAINNKLGELEQKFRKNGVSFYAKYVPEIDTVIHSDVGNSIVADLLDYELEAQEYLNDVYTEINDILAKKKNNQSLEANNPIKRFFGKLKMRFSSHKYEPLLDDSDKKKIYNRAQIYNDACEKVASYNIRDNINESVAKGFTEQYSYYQYTSSQDSESLLNEEIIPTYQKLGIADLLPELKNMIEEKYRKKEENFVDYIKVKLENNIEIDQSEETQNIDKGEEKDNRAL